MSQDTPEAVELARRVLVEYGDAPLATAIRQLGEERDELAAVAMQNERWQADYREERDAARAEVVSLQWAKAALVEQQRQTQIAFAEAEQRKREAERLRGALEEARDHEDESILAEIDNASVGAPSEMQLEWVMKGLERAAVLVRERMATRDKARAALGGEATAPTPPAEETDDEQG